ncbi:hypothetical protein [Cohnella cellulosilytica]|uniref:Glucosamine inositolphosphorylceramide transferase 1 N-terminal domain-containing protein n=1 Tax=Cohnella cellulosilytica TaxID=986710 RepID=A0ABW2FN11_9BACL
MLKIAVLRDAAPWDQGEIGYLRALSASSHARISCIAEVRAAAAPAASPGWLRRTARQTGKPVREAPEIEGLPVLELVDEAELADALSPLAPDAILDLRRAGQSRALADLARFGLWRFRYGQASDDAAGFVFRLLLADDPAGTVSLVRVGRTAERDLLLKRGHISSYGAGFGEKLDELYRFCRSWPASVCRELALSGRLSYTAEEEVRSEAENGRPGPGPTALQAIRLAALLGYRKLARRLSAWFVVEQWNVGVIRQPIDAVMRGQGEPTVEWLPERAGFVADPFAVRLEEGMGIVAEEWDHVERKGKISFLKLDRELRIDPEARWQQAVLELPVHLSYPCIVQEEGRLYCIPECYQAGEAAIYRAERFPVEWKKIKVLIPNFQAVDPTVFRHDGLWWLICTDQEEGPHSHLHIWYSDELLGEWKPHPANPVKMDVRSSRPAGTPFAVGEALFRPAQDCSGTYGGAVWINRIDRLTTTEFRETPVRRLAPDRSGPYPDGLHTLSFAGEATLVDAKRERLALGVFARRATIKLVRKIRRTDRKGAEAIGSIP